MNATVIIVVLVIAAGAYWYLKIRKPVVGSSVTIPNFDIQAII